MPTECDICGRVCAGERRLNEHIQRKHKTSFKCKNCDEVGYHYLYQYFLIDCKHFKNNILGF